MKRNLSALILLSTLLLGCGAQRVASPDSYRTALALIQAGTAAIEQRRLDEALAAFQLSLEIEPSAPAFDGLGCVALLQGEYRLAENYFSRALKHDPNYATAYANRALLLEIQGQLVEARRHYQHALSLEPENFRARNNFAALLADNGISYHTVRAELLKAQVLVDHEVVDENLNLLEEKL